MKNKPTVTAVILAGGRGRRMGGLDKGLIEFDNKPIIEHIISAIAPQCDDVIINANRNIELYSKYGYPVLTDSLDNFQGPLAGFSTALSHINTPLLLTLPCDAPDLPKDLTNRMLNTMMKEDSDITVAHDGERLQPVYALIKTSLAENLHEFLLSGNRKIDLWYAANKTSHVDFSDVSQLFQNINTPEQQQRMQGES